MLLASKHPSNEAISQCPMPARIAQFVGLSTKHVRDIIDRKF